MPPVDLDLRRIEQPWMALHRGAAVRTIRAKLAALIGASALRQRARLFAAYALAHATAAPGAGASVCCSSSAPKVPPSIGNSGTSPHASPGCAPSPVPAPITGRGACSLSVSGRRGFPPHSKSVTAHQVFADVLVEDCDPFQHRRLTTTRDPHHPHYWSTRRLLGHGICREIAFQQAKAAESVHSESSRILRVAPGFQE